MSEPKRHLVKTSSTEFLVFTTDTENSLEVRYEDDTIWLTQKLMGKLFDVEIATVNYHLTQIFAQQELDEAATIRDFLIVQSEGSRQVNRKTKHYNLDVIILVGYRVNSLRATQFRQWATGVLRNFTLRGYVLDRARMESGEILGHDYFEYLLQEIREIRLSERRFYQKVTDIYATAVDYRVDTVLTRKFFATVQNKLHYAVHQHTAAELINERADSQKPNMGLTTWKHGPEGKILRGDVTVAKNYLNKEELDALGRIVEAFLNLAESRAQRHIPTTMEQWSQFLDQVLVLDARELLTNAGKISKNLADQYALTQYETFRVTQDQQYVSDFDCFTREALETINGNTDE